MGHAKDSSGIWGHSSTVGANSYFIFAVSGGLINEKAFMGWAASQSIGLKPLLGSYKGVTENSFIVNDDNYDKIKAAGWLKGQESILILGACDSRDRRPAYLHYLDTGRTKSLGVLQSVDRDTALKQDAWSYDPSQKEYFICSDPDAIKICPIGLKAAIAEHCRQHEKLPGYNQDTEALIRTYLAARRII